MPKAKVNNIEVEYTTFGDPSAKPFLMVMGLGGQMISWDDRLIEEIVKRGFYVIVFDNRDSGLSTKFEDACIPDVMKAISAQMRGKKVEAPYLLKDMANDAVGLLEYLDIEKAHICGSSMGGMIAQTIAINHPSRVLSLTSIMSTTGDPELPQTKPIALKFIMTPAPKERGAYIEHLVEIWRNLWGSKFPYDEERIRKKAAMSFDRSFYPQGKARQNVAIIASGDRTEQLTSVKLLALIIHGKEDPLIPHEGAIATSKAILGAELMLVEGMGHGLPHEIFPQMVDAIVAITEKASTEL
ncbi:MAG: alpha/beta fold hydrolase [Promethearchaeota archaeon]